MNQVIINGVSISAPPGANVSVINGRVLVDGKDVSGQLDLSESILKIDVTGTQINLTTDASVSCGNIEGDVSAGGSINCKSVQGDVRAGGSINCGAIEGNVRAGGSINRS